ncbi:translation initiation factor IF-3 [Desulfohalobiaceae bacterium Ax17]|nr:translation initiation factor IF-3 [Desulfovulcanus ferrireducens]
MKARRNRQIRAKEVRVINVDGQQLGIMDIAQALQHAQAMGLDLVEVAPNANPPVCRIMDYGKFQYQQQKKQQEAKKKQTKIQLKEIKVRPKTDENDLQTKVRHIRRFIEKGDRCKVTVFFRGRELAHKDRGLEILKKIVEMLSDIAKVEQQPKFEGRTMNLILSPIAGKKKVN